MTEKPDMLKKITELAAALQHYKAWLIVLIPALLALGLTLHYSFYVPLSDEWVTPGESFQRIIEGNLTYQDYFEILFKQHNETRDMFPRLIFLVVGFTVGWHGTILTILSWACILLTLLMLLKILPRYSQQPSLVFLYVALLLSALLFSPVQWENQLWSIQIIMLIPPLCLVLCLWLQSTQLSFRVKVMACALLSIVATFSNANGMIVWLLAFPLFRSWLAGELQETSRRKRINTFFWTGLYLTLALVTIGLYFWDYQKPDTTPPFSVVLQDPSLGAKFFLIWLGTPFRFNPPFLSTLIVGSGIIVVLIIAITLVGQQWKQSADMTILEPYYPWLALIAYGILSGLVTTFGRAGFGLEAAIVSRYTSVSLWVIIGLVGLLYNLRLFQKSGLKQAMNVGFALAIGIASILTALAWANGYRDMQAANLRSQQHLLTLRLLDVAPTNPLLGDLTRPWPVKLQERTHLLVEHGILNVELIGGWLNEKLMSPDGGHAGWFHIIDEQNKKRIEGWAMIPNQGVPADFVMLATTDHSGQVEPISGFIINTKRPDVVEALDNPNLLLSGFNDSLESALVKGRQFKMFAVDLNRQRVFELEQENDPSEVVHYSFLDYLDSAEVKSELEEAVPRQKVEFTINDDQRRVLFEHPNSEVVFEGVPIETEAHLKFGIGISQAAWDQPGDGVLFELIVVDEKSAWHVILSQYIDPKNKMEDRHWVDNQINLAAFAGQTVSFIFKTRGGPQGNTAYDWAGWSSPQIVYSGL